jgi:hypothetical protein
MSEFIKKNQLPRATKHDIDENLLEDIIDPIHKSRWDDFAVEQPDLAQEILRRSFFISTDPSLGSLAVRKIIIDTVTYTYAVLRSAARRDQTTDDGDGEDPQL